MNITFCGHRSFFKSKEYERKVLNFLEAKIGYDSATIYLGEYGDFDSFAYECCKKYKLSHPNVSLVLVTPYITPEYQSNHLNYEKEKYDLIVYPGIEDKPLKFAISYRNKYMVEKSDCVIAYVDHRWGGAYKTYMWARKKGKEIFNISEKEV